MTSWKAILCRFTGKSIFLKSIEFISWYIFHTYTWHPKQTFLSLAIVAICFPSCENDKPVGRVLLWKTKNTTIIQTSEYS